MNNSCQPTCSFGYGIKRMSAFVRYQVAQIGEGWPAVLFKKLLILFLTLSLMIPAFIIILFVRLLRPLALIRFGALRNEKIGHFGINTEVYMCEHDIEKKQNRKIIDIFYYNFRLPFCNQQLKKMWSRVLHVCNFAYWLDAVNRRLPGYERHAIPMPSDRDVKNLFMKIPPHLYFTPEEEDIGRRALLELGIKEDIPFVCFHSRDHAYLDHTEPRRDWHYHDYRDCDIENYISAAEEMVKKGYFAIRMGFMVKKPLTTTNPRIIDYATRHRTDFLDIYLSAKCRFFLCSTGGISAIPIIFRRPTAFVNLIPLEYIPSWNSRDLFIPKKLWLCKENRFMTFQEILDSGAGGFLTTEQYKRLGVEVVENTQQEIRDLALEMNERLEGIWRTTKEDEELQYRFKSLFKPNELRGEITSRIGADFLRQNRELLK